MAAWLTGCAATDSRSIYTSADVNRDGILSDAEYRAERERILRDTAAAEANLEELRAR